MTIDFGWRLPHAIPVEMFEEYRRVGSIHSPQILSVIPDRMIDKLKSIDHIQ